MAGIRVATVVLLVVLVTAPDVPLAATDAEAGVRAAIEAYVEGYNKRDRKLLERAFDAPRAHVKSLVKVDDGPDRIKVTPVPEWIDKVATDAPPLDVQVRILSVTVVNDHIANAFLDWDGVLFDMMLVGKIDGVWRILNKVSIYQDPNRR